MLKNQYNFSPNAVTVTQVVANLGAMAGGTTVGYSKLFREILVRSHYLLQILNASRFANLWAPLLHHRRFLYRWHPALSVLIYR